MAVTDGLFWIAHNITNTILGNFIFLCSKYLNMATADQLLKVNFGNPAFQYQAVIQTQMDMVTLNMQYLVAIMLYVPKNLAEYG